MFSSKNKKGLKILPINECGQVSHGRNHEACVSGSLNTIDTEECLSADKGVILAQLDRVCGVKIEDIHPELLQYDLEVMIGKGSFAKVALARHKSTNKIHAMKIMSKAHIVNRNQVQNVIHERELMASLTHPFVVRLYSAFQTAKKIFMVLEFCGGGELYFHMKKEKKFPIDTARFFSATIALALTFLHKRGILFRDLKAENVLMVDTGYIKLSDFGLARSGVTEWLAGAKTMCGTPQYMAPETFLTENYGLSCDWWALGVLMYEMIGGIPPFRGKSSKEIYRSVVESKLILLSSWPQDVKYILAQALSKNPKNRIGRNGEHEILEHDFFAPVDLVKLESMELESPYKPEIADMPLGQLLDEGKNLKKPNGCTLEVSYEQMGADATESFDLGGGGQSKCITPSSGSQWPPSAKSTCSNISEKFFSYMSSLNVDPRKFEALNNDDTFDSIYASNIVTPIQDPHAADEEKRGSCLDQEASPTAQVKEKDTGGRHFGGLLGMRKKGSVDINLGHHAYGKDGNGNPRISPTGAGTTAGADAAKKKGSTHLQNFDYRYRGTADGRGSDVNSEGDEKEEDKHGGMAAMRGRANGRSGSIGSIDSEGSFAPGTRP